MTSWAGSDAHHGNPLAIVNAIHCVSNIQRRCGNTPIVVHCSDTVRRSGAFCAAARAIEQCRVEKTIDVFQAVKAVRSQKPGAVPTVVS